jgi:predicted nucleotidyltransferase
MFPKENLKHIPKNKLIELEKVLDVIEESGFAEIVILFASYARGDFTLKEGKWTGEISDFDLFVITSGKKQRYRLSSFHLQQVFEKSYKLIYLILTKYEKNEHKFLSLRMKEKKLDSRIDKIFKIETESDKNSFEYLCKAYIGGRHHLPKTIQKYKSTYNVTKEEVKFWKEELVKITKIICEEKIILLEN